MSANSIEDEFQEEVLKLFALEALEWLRQIKSALQELEGEPAPDRAPKLYDIVFRGLTNLKGSAATVDLPSLESLAYTLVPLLQAMRGRKTLSSSEHYAVFRQGLESLSSAVQLLAVTDKKLAVVADLERITQRQTDAVKNALSKVQAMAPAPIPSPREEEPPAPITAAAIITALLDLKRPRSPSSEPTRNLVEVVLRKIHGILDLDSAEVTAASITRILQDIEVLDERFLEEARHRLPVIAEALAGLKSDATSKEKRAQTALQEIAVLYETARAVDATMMVQFLHGLETLLMEVYYKRITVHPQRFEVVGSRLRTILTEAQTWVDVGKAERAVIEKVLAQLMGTKPALKP
jgi:chemotaxis protein histidine kinase CheA